MLILFAWCWKPQGTKEPLTDHSLTHSICPRCLDNVRQKLALELAQERAVVLR